MDPQELPHLTQGTAEFATLADAHATVDSVTIPLHSHILSRASHVFAQFFSSFHSSGDSDAADVSSLLGATTLAPAMLAIFLMYNPDVDTVRRVFTLQIWGPASTTSPSLPPINPAMLQQTVELLDRLDVRGVLKIVQSSEFIKQIVSSDLLGWTLTGARLHLPLKDEALVCMLDVFKKLHHHRITPQSILQDPRWPEMSQDVLCMMIDALVVSHQSTAMPTKHDMASWNKMGDLLEGSEPRVTHTDLQLYPASDYEDLDDEAQHLQAMIDYENEHDGMLDTSEDGEEEEDGQEEEEVEEVTDPDDSEEEEVEEEEEEEEEEDEEDDHEQESDENEDYEEFDEDGEPRPYSYMGVAFGSAPW